MSRQNSIRVEGTIVQALPNMVFHVELPNGHRLLAHVPGRKRVNGVRFGAGDKVVVEMSPYDFSKGCIAIQDH